MVRSSAGRPFRTYRGRLEHIRKATGLDMRAFHGKLEPFRESITEGRFPSYEAALTYHKTDRLPSVEYLTVVSRAHGVPLHWLHTGEGPKTIPDAARLTPEGIDTERKIKEWQTRFRAMEAASERLPLLGLSAFPGRDQLLEGLTLRLLGSGGIPAESYQPDQFEEALFLIAWLMMLPADALWSAPSPLADPRSMEAYSLAMTTAIRLAMPPADLGYPIHTLSALRNAKAAWDARLSYSYRLGDEMDQELTRVRRGGKPAGVKGGKSKRKS